MTAPRQARGLTRLAPYTVPAPPGRQTVRLRLVPDPATRRVRRRAQMLTAFIGILAGAGLFGIVIVHVLLAQGEGTVQQLQAKVQQESAQQQRLQVQVAQLESPQRIVSTATGKLGMVTPSTVVPLAPASLADPPPTTIPAPRPTAPTTVAAATASSPPTTAAAPSPTTTASTPRP